MISSRGLVYRQFIYCMLLYLSRVPFLERLPKIDWHSSDTMGTYDATRRYGTLHAEVCDVSGGWVRESKATETGVAQIDRSTLHCYLAAGNFRSEWL